MKRTLKDLMKEKKPVLGTFQQIIHPMVTETLANTGLDYIILDLEHTGRSMESAIPCILAASAYDIPMIVRPMDRNPSLIEQALDAGALGVLVPTVETAEQCEIAVKAAKYAPEGNRGFCPVYPARRWVDNRDATTFTEDVNKGVFVSVLIETPLGFENLPEILKVEGLDAVMLGLADYSKTLGKDTWDPEVAAVANRANEQILASGKLCIQLATQNNVKDLLDLGNKIMCIYWSDSGAMDNYLRAEVASIRSMVE